MKQFPCFKQVGLFWNNPPAPRKQGLFPQFDGSSWHWAAMSWEHTFFFICTMVNNGKYLLSFQPRGALCSRDLSQCWLRHKAGHWWEQLGMQDSPSSTLISSFLYQEGHLPTHHSVLRHEKCAYLNTEQIHFANQKKIRISEGYFFFCRKNLCHLKKLIFFCLLLSTESSWILKSLFLKNPQPTTTFTILIY